MNRISLRILGLAAAMGVCLAAHAQQFKWVDKDGRVQYGDTPPPGVNATRLRPPPPGPSSGQAPAAKKGEKPLSPEAAFQKRQKEAKEEEDKDAKDRAEAESRRVNCATAQASLRQIQSGQRLTTMNAAGERVYLDDDARAREAERAQKAVGEWCK